MKGYIYKWTNVINNKVYVGQTLNKKRRYREFMNTKSYYTSNNPDNLSKIDKARLKYGINNFSYELLEEIEYEDKEELLDGLNRLEDYYVTIYDSIKNGYNTIKGGSAYVHKPRTNVVNKGGRSKIDYIITNQTVYLPYDFKGTPQEALMYLYIQLYQVNNISTVSYKELTKISSIATKTIVKYIKSLERLNYLEINYEVSPIEYKFSEISGMCISYDLLNNSDLTFTEKSYIVAAHQYMYKEDNEGKISYTNKELSNLIHMPESTISKCNRSLEAKGYLEGASEFIKRFPQHKLNLIFIEKFKEQDERLNKHDADINLLKKEIEQLKEENKVLREHRKYIM